MRQTLRMLILMLAPSVLAAAQQEVIYYKFETGDGRNVINYWGHTGLAPGEGVFDSRVGYSKSTLWAPGRHGFALKGKPDQYQYVLVDTGFMPNYRGSFTVAYFFKIRRLFTTNQTAVFFRGGSGTNLPTFQFYLGNQKKGITVEGWARTTNQAAVTMSQDVYTPALTRWVHFAAVFDGPGRVIRFYVDGNAVLPEPMGSYEPELWRGNLNLRLGDGGGYGSFDLDEFRLLFRVATPVEIQRWASADNPAADGAYGRACHPRGRSVLLDSNRAKAGAPRIGNTRYAADVFGPANSLFHFGLGTSRLSFFGKALPMDLGKIHPPMKGCFWETSVDLGVLAGALNTAGTARVSLPVPNQPSLVGIVLYSQALLYNATIPAWMTTNGLAMVIGK